MLSSFQCGLLEMYFIGLLKEQAFGSIEELYFGEVNSIYLPGPWSECLAHSFEIIFLFFSFLAIPAVCGSFQARDQTRATAATKTAAGTMMDP